MLGVRCKPMDKETIRRRVVAILVLCIQVDGKLCFKWTHWDGNRPCDCVTLLEKDLFSWCIHDVVKALSELVHIHITAGRFMVDMNNIIPLISKKLVSLRLESLIPRERSIQNGPRSIDLTRLCAVNNLTELHLHDVPLSTTDGKNIEMLTRLKSLILDYTVNMETAHHLFCKQTLPDLTEFYWTGGGDIGGLQTFVEKCPCPCFVECFQRLKWTEQYPGAEVSIDHTHLKLLQVFGLCNPEKIMVEIREIPMKNPWVLREYGLKYGAYFSFGVNLQVVDLVHCPIRLICTLIKDQPQFRLTSINWYIDELDDLDSYDVSYLRKLFTTVDESFKIELKRGDKELGCSTEKIQQFVGIINESKAETLTVTTYPSNGVVRDVVRSLQKTFPALTIELLVSNYSEIY